MVFVYVLGLCNGFMVDLFIFIRGKVVIIEINVEFLNSVIF